MTRRNGTNNTLHYGAVPERTAAHPTLQHRSRDHADRVGGFHDLPFRTETSTAHLCRAATATHLYPSRSAFSTTHARQPRERFHGAPRPTSTDRTSANRILPDQSACLSASSKTQPCRPRERFLPKTILTDRTLPEPATTHLSPSHSAPSKMLPCLSREWLLTRACPRQTGLNRADPNLPHLDMPGRTLNITPRRQPPVPPSASSESCSPPSRR
jgi:hypothetical protein